MGKFRIVWMGPEDEPERRPPDAVAPALPPHYSRLHYEQLGHEMILREGRQSGREKVTPLANFIARIVREIVYDDGPEHRRDFGLEVEVAGNKISLVVPAAEFARMSWVLRRLGPAAIIYPGQQQHARTAIQCLSSAVRQERVFTRLGWRKQGDQWVYLQSRTAIGPGGSLTGLQMRLPPPLEHYDVQPPTGPDVIVGSVRASLDVLSVAPDRIGVPLLAGVYHAPFGNTDFSLYLTGRTGTFKTALAALCQQHFGAQMDARHLPGNFASTSNALEELAFQAKDSLVVIDDFAPSGGGHDSVLEAVAERLFRGAGNGQGRSRIRGSQLQVQRPPCALLLATGEEVPRGHSIRARLLILELWPGDVDRAALSKWQIAGQQGQLAGAMGAYLVWIARDYENRQAQLSQRSRELRDEARKSASIHARLPGMMAELLAGWEMWLQFALESGAIGNSEQLELLQRGQKAFEEVTLVQRLYHQASDPTLQFLSLIQTALSTGHAHLADRRGEVPESPECWGWRRPAKGRAWRAIGGRIGWVVGTDVFLEPQASYHMAQQLAGPERMPISAQTLRHRLREQGLLASVEVGRQTLLVRRILEGVPRKVLHFRASDLLNFDQNES